MNYNRYYKNEDAAPHGHAASQESTILLATEQIIAENQAKIPLSEQNAIIRLTASVKKYGILEPLGVKFTTAESGYPSYLLIDGARRLRAATLAGIRRVPCIILPPNDPKCLQMAEISALKCQNQHYFVQAERFLYLIQTLHITQEELARKLGLSQSAVANKLRLLQFDAEERHLLCSTAQSERHARCFLRIHDKKLRLEVMAAVVKAKLNVADTEALISRTLGENTPISLKSTQNEPIKPQNAPIFQENTPKSPPLSRSVPGEDKQGIVPRKFALRDLTPLYNSIERTLSIFEKTGVAAEYQKQEDDYSAKITIYIPKHS